MKFLPKWWIALFIFLIAVVMTGGGWWYRHEKKEVEALIASQLEAVSILKVEAIKSWSFERKGDALVLSANPFIKDFLLSYERNIPPDKKKELFAGVTNYLKTVSADYNYDNVLVTDVKGKVLVGVKETKALDESALIALEKALKLKEPVITDLHFEDGVRYPHARVVAGIYEDKNGKAIGALVLKVDAEKFIYSFLELMPISNRAVESFLVRKDGDEVLFLSELKNRAGAALNLRIPLTYEKNIAVMAVKGKEGLVQGNDYQGKEALAFIVPVPDSPWKLITQIESGKVFAWLSKAGFSILSLWDVIILFLAAAFIGVKERYKKAHYRALSRMNERFAVTLRSIGDAVIVVNPAGQVEMLNPVAEQLTGWQEGEARGKKIKEIFHIVNEETRMEVENPVQRVLREGIVVGLANHTLLISRTGKEIPIADSGAPIKIPQQGIVGVVLVFRDQTAERKAQKEIKEAKEFAEGIVATVRDALVVLDSSLRIVSANRYFYSTFNVKPEEIEGKSIFEIAGRRWDNPKLRELLEKIIPSNSSFDGFEIVYEDELGEKRTFLLNARRLYTEGGETRRILLALDDITERKRYEDNLNHTISLLQATLDSTEDGILVIDRKGRVSAYNKKFLELWRIPEKLAEEKDDNKLLAFVYDQLKEPDKFMERVRELYNKPEEVSYDEIHFKDRRIFERYSQPQRLGNEIIGRVWSFRDVTEKRKAQEDARRSKEIARLGEIAALVAHDFNNQLNIIGNSLDMLGKIRSSADNIMNIGEEKKWTSYLKNAVQTCTETCRSLLIAAKHTVVELMPEDLNECVQEYNKKFGRIKREDIALKINLWKKPLPILADRHVLSNILVNLVANATDAMAGRKGDITISTFLKEVDEEFCKSCPDALPGKYAVLAASDKGCGIDEETLKYIFEPFFTTKKSGTGIGLGSVKNAVAQMNGFINVKSEVNKGSTFELYFPIHEGAPPKTAKKEEITELIKEKVKEKGWTILLVEDHPAVLESLGALLEILGGYTVLRASSPRNALETAESYEGEIHVLLTDVLLPEMNGRELHETVKKIRPNIKCLYMSGYPSDVLLSKGISHEEMNFIWKPVDSKKLIVKLYQLLEECPTAEA